MEKIKNKLISKIEYISKRYEYYGFWKLGTAYVNGVSRDDNPYLHFPCEEYAHKTLMEEFDKLTEEDFKPIEGINGFLYFKDGDRLDIPFEVFKQKPEIHIGVPYVSVSYKRQETEVEIYGRLLIKIVHNAQQKYIKELG